ncbi:hypothetical protein CARUB_v10007788mg [Capsella rubella]|uniref:Knottin scorpion toxin-like domain-containing protein n=1 Tax=Capsella rubella TaxID=81985 RepID=R0GQF6_9BRAS|nr:defensin-like protein 91 [Capsella rubella]EOA19119.1 hypothetical protein CARUB_v10007788mg [Capsella rubella]
MATKCFSPFLLFSLMIFALILMPMISAFMPMKPYIEPCLKGCKNQAECIKTCMSMGHPKGGDCLGNQYGNYCCCIAGLMSQNDSPISKSNVPTF